MKPQFNYDACFLIGVNDIYGTEPYDLPHGFHDKAFRLPCLGEWYLSVHDKQAVEATAQNLIIHSPRIILEKLASPCEVEE